MQYKYNEQAKESGVFIVGTCGFDSIPADMGVDYTQKKFPGTVQIDLLSIMKRIDYDYHLLLEAF